MDWINSVFIMWVVTMALLTVPAFWRGEPAPDPNTWDNL